MLKAIIAVDQNWGIAKEGKIPFKDTNDLKFFREMTLDQNIIMGNKTYETIYEQYKKPLDKRLNIVMTRDLGKVKNQSQFNHLVYTNVPQINDGWIIGGEEIYRMYEPIIDEWYISMFYDDYDCDKFFKPNLDNFDIMTARCYDKFMIKYCVKRK